VSGPPLTFPLVSRRRGIGVAGALLPSRHRGSGYEIASSRPYQRGDSVRSIDWNASARVSSAREVDEFVVHERFAEEVLRSVVFVDRRPEMSLYPQDLPWLSKPAAVAVAGEMIVDSTLAVQGIAGYLDVAEADQPQWVAPRSARDAARARASLNAPARFRAPHDNLGTGLQFLVEARRHLPHGSFVFVLSDFLAPPPRAVWEMVAGAGWDVVPVVVQDPRWEQAFPNVRGVALPLVRPDDGGFELVRLTRREVAARRLAHAERFAALQRDFATFGLDPVIVSTADPHAIQAAFVAWHELRALRGSRA
jgi:uncharacterized protein (DUF58 family)